ncbi:N-acetyl-gamma-glutamyl-phosphate reductase [Thermoanaerobacterium sp. DL9XJH110]|uniref:N-acetyl-gamma-glutamyl-phosphate reductase n=1 Tax=Thermoanaerobacterium sp. DL9XJH110 TaxID=3386643 RepID=UPI003BB7AD36
MKIKVGIVGATGYTGEELVRILSRHPRVEFSALISQSYVGKGIDQVYPNLRGFAARECSELDTAQIVAESDVIFVALPHGHSARVVREAAVQGRKVIDLGADFRFDDVSIYEKWYQVAHEAPDLLKKAVYGLPELHGEAIAKAQVIGNPGCYPTSAILALAPALKEGLVDPASVIIDSKSGISGAGRTLTLESHFAECNENVKAYNLARHRHTPEIEQELSKICGVHVTVTFTPHMIPMTRGILTTAYALLRENLKTVEVLDAYRRFYEGKPFVRVREPGEFPQTKWVWGSNYCDLGLEVDERTGRLIVVSAIDNLVKGASGQAVQNMNLMFGFPETMGLEYPGIYP